MRVVRSCSAQERSRQIGRQDQHPALGAAQTVRARAAAGHLPGPDGPAVRLVQAADATRPALLRLHASAVHRHVRGQLRVPHMRRLAQPADRQVHTRPHHHDRSAVLLVDHPADVHVGLPRKGQYHICAHGRSELR